MDRTTTNKENSGAEGGGVQLQAKKQETNDCPSKLSPVERQELQMKKSRACGHVG